ncbi:Metal-dependent carboxypeptidase [uncultured Gammaproteobacteria bacterium]
MTAYHQLERRFTRIAAVADAIGILNWDCQTMMPAGAAPGRVEQTATLHGLLHELQTDPRLEDLLSQAEAEHAGPDPWQRANLREMRRSWLHAAAVPAELVEASSRASSECEMVWRSARAASDFALLRPSLEIVLERQREVGAAKATLLGGSPYEALLDAYEPGGRTAVIDALFDQVAGFLPELIERALEHQDSLPDPEPIPGPFPLEAQRTLGEHLMRAAGFDFERGRLDVSLHPFCGGATGDTRITTRYAQEEFLSALFGVVHETGHALYEQGRPEHWLFQPVGTARSMSIHESQSLLVEMQAARCRPFITYLAPLAQQTFGGEGACWSADNLLRHVTQVKRSFIRTEADEITYPAHVILRYRLEKAMVGGELAVADLPEAWAQGMRALLGITPPDDRRGCLQDIHWPGGGWGYFPTYTLGAMTAAQMFDAACRDDAELLPALGRGEFGPLVAWLRRQVHGHASLLTTEDLIESATGQPLNVAIYRRHLERRYLER